MTCSSKRSLQKASLLSSFKDLTKRKNVLPFLIDHTQLAFPPVEYAMEDGLLAIGGDLQPQRLLLAYQNGIFPWYSEESPILWWSPDPRFVLFPEDMYVSKTLQSVIKKQKFEIRVNTQFAQVLQYCAQVPRPGQDGTWLLPEMQEAYTYLHSMGNAHSIEAWHDGKLVGGLYGVKMGKVFCGESMFAIMPDASKVALAHFCKYLCPAWHIQLIDCQVHTTHLESLGATFLSRKEFLKYLI